LLSEYAKAIEQYGIISSDPNYANAWYNKGLALSGLGNIIFSNL
jgi:hypothetical protein